MRHVPARSMAILAIALSCQTAMASPVEDATGGSPASQGPGGLRERALLRAARHGDVALLASLADTLPDTPLKHLVLARVAAGSLRADIANEHVAEFLGAGDRSDLPEAYGILADINLAVGNYDAADDAAQQRLHWLRELSADHEDLQDAAVMASITTQLRDAPAQRVAAHAPVADSYARDKVGLARMGILVNGGAQEAVLDTGANISVLSASAAKRLGVDVRPGAASVGTSSRSAIQTNVAVARSLSIGGVTIENVAFLVLDDSQLELPVPGGYRIDAIVGFPVFRALERVRFRKDGGFVIEPGADRREAPAPQNMWLSGSDLFVDATVNGIDVAMHLDSGASASSLSSRFAAEHPDIVSGLARSIQGVAGAGGSTTRGVVLWPDVTVTVDGTSVELPKIAVTVEESGETASQVKGVLGGDVLNAHASWTIDFRSMRVELTPEAGR